MRKSYFFDHTLCLLFLLIFIFLCLFLVGCDSMRFNGSANNYQVIVYDGSLEQNQNADNSILNGAAPISEDNLDKNAQVPKQQDKEDVASQDGSTKTSSVLHDSSSFVLTHSNLSSVNQSLFLSSPNRTDFSNLSVSQGVNLSILTQNSSNQSENCLMNSYCANATSNLNSSNNSFNSSINQTISVAQTNTTSNFSNSSIINSNSSTINATNNTSVFFLNQSAQIRYLPKPNATWNIQFSGTLNLSYNVSMYDLDLDATSISTINSLHARGIKVTCYFSAGSWENYRADASAFPSEVLGNTLSGWPDEKWLDVAHFEKFQDVILARMDLAVSKKCDALDLDNIDGYTNDNGFNLTYADQLRYNIWLANEAHKRNLSVGLKNDLLQINDLVDYYDFAINEQCFYYNECEYMLPFVEKNKAVFGIEYQLSASKFCAKAKNFSFSWIKKSSNLGQMTNLC